jgi:homoserine dehydrogenase
VSQGEVIGECRRARVKRIEIVQLGLGYVGRAVAQIVLEERKYWRERHNVEIAYKAVSDTSGALLGEELLPRAIRLKEEGGKLSELGVEPIEDVLFSEPAPGRTRVVVDLAVHGGTFDLDVLGVQGGAHLVLSNKGPLSGGTEQYEQLVQALPDRLWYEATVGAGMPIISTLNGLMESGDELLEIRASPSGTLGFIMSEVESGRSFSEAVKKAVELHYAEPDPRDDLSGLDVARKAIILARTMGRRIEPEEIPYESLVSAGLEDVSLEEFMERLPEADEEFAERLLAVEEHHMLRYLARIPAEGPVEVGLQDTPVESPFGPITGPENVFDFHTRRYSDVTLTISGPGAGPERTASGVVFDLLDIAHKAVRDDEEI